MSDTLLREDSNAVASLTLNTPQKLNVLSDDMLSSLKSQLDAIANDCSIRAVIIKGAGKAFCAGHDITEMTAARRAEDGGKAYFNDLFARCGRLMTSITTMPQPVIAQVHGIATAAGCQLVASCDMAIATEETRFGVNGVNIGLFCSTPMVALSRNVPRKVAFEMLTTGEFISAEKAQAFGLVNRVVPAEDLEAQTLALANKIAGQLGVAIKIGKEAFYNQSEMNLEDAYTYTAQVMAENMLYRDTENGMDAFLDKRHPEWDQ